MNTLDSTSLSLKTLLEEIREGKIQLPVFQRGWIWNDSHIRSLLVSIAREFPVGAIMLLDAGGEVSFKSRLIANVELSNEAKPKAEKLILDGQQRLTSLTHALMLDGPVRTRNSQGRKIKCHYYIDIDAALRDDRLEDAFIRVQEDRKYMDKFDRKVLMDLSQIEFAVEHFHFPCSQIFNSSEWDMAIHKIGDKRHDKYIEFRSKVLSKFNDYRVPVIRLDKATSKEAVCAVFEKVNTGGVPLSVFDLVTASFAADGDDESDGFNLRADLLGSNEDDEDDTGKEGRLKELSSESVLNGIKPEDFLQVVSILHTYERKMEKQEAAISCKRAAILELPVESYKKLADVAVNGFRQAAMFLRNQGVLEEKEVSYRTQIISLAAILAHIGERWRTRDDIRNCLSQWFWCGIFGELYGGAVETRIANDFENFVDWMSYVEQPSDGTRNQPPDFYSIRNAVFQESRLDTLQTKQSAAYKGLCALVVREGAKDFYYKDTIRSLERDERPIDIHHIFPRIWCENNGISRNMYNSIVNKTMISSKANRKIGGNAPSKYIEALQNSPEGGSSDMDDILRSHNISPAEIRKNAFNDFYSNRKNQLIELIENAMGKPVQRGQ